MVRWDKPGVKPAPQQTAQPKILPSRAGGEMSL